MSNIPNALLQQSNEIIEFFTERVPPISKIMSRDYRTTRTGVLRFRFVRVSANGTSFLITLRRGSVIDLIVGINETISIMRFRAQDDPNYKITIRLTQINRRSRRTIVLHNGFHGFVRRVESVLHLHLSQYEFIIRTIRQIRSRSTTAATSGRFTNFNGRAIKNNVTFRKSVKSVLNRGLLKTYRRSLHRTTTILRAITNGFLGRFTRVVSSESILQARRTGLPLVSRTRARCRFIRPFQFSHTEHSNSSSITTTFMNASFIRFLPPHFNAKARTIIRGDPRITIRINNNRGTFRKGFRHLFSDSTRAFRTVFSRVFVNILTIQPMNSRTTALNARTISGFITRTSSNKVNISNSSSFFRILRINFRRAIRP